jgi:hypothetical protein
MRDFGALGWVYFVLTVLFGLFLYWLRCHHRVLYGAAEIVVALLLIYIFFFPEHRGVLQMIEWGGPLGPVWGELLSRAVTLFGGLYALVRGLDNVDALEKWNRLTRRRNPRPARQPHSAAPPTHRITTYRA